MSRSIDLSKCSLHDFQKAILKSEPQLTVANKRNFMIGTKKYNLNTIIYYLKQASQRVSLEITPQNLKDVKTIRVILDKIKSWESEEAKAKFLEGLSPSQRRAYRIRQKIGNWFAKCFLGITRQNLDDQFINILGRKLPDDTQMRIAELLKGKIESSAKFEKSDTPSKSKEKAGNKKVHKEISKTTPQISPKSQEKTDEKESDNLTKNKTQLDPIQEVEGSQPAEKVKVQKTGGAAEDTPPSKPEYTPLKYAKQSIENGDGVQKTPGLKPGNDESDSVQTPPQDYPQEELSRWEQLKNWLTPKTKPKEVKPVTSLLLSELQKKFHEYRLKAFGDENQLLNKNILTLLKKDGNKEKFENETTGKLLYVKATQKLQYFIEHAGGKLITASRMRSDNHAFILMLFQEESAEKIMEYLKKEEQGFTVQALQS